MFRFFAIGFIFCLFSCFQTFSQEIKPEGRFRKETIKIGQPVEYILTIEYPRRFNVVFPDSTFDFGKFEYLSRVFFPTISSSEKSKDSVVYTLTTFELDTGMLELSLPVFLVSEDDSLALEPETSAVQLITVFNQQEDQQPELKTDTSYFDVIYRFDVWVFGLILGSIILISLILVLIFGKGLRNKIKAARLRRKHRRFIKAYFELLRRVEQKRSAVNIEKASVTWKKYMEGMERLPMTKYTTKELWRVYNNEELDSNLKLIDRSIYSSASANGQILKSLEYLMKFSSDRLDIKIKAIGNG